PSSNSSLDHRHGDAHAAENGFAAKSSVNKSAKVVLGRVLINGPSRVRLPPNRTSSRHRRMTESETVDGDHSPASSCYKLLCVTARRSEGGEARERYCSLKFCGNWRGDDDGMQTGSIRGSGAPAWASSS